MDGLTRGRCKVSGVDFVIRFTLKMMAAKSFKTLVSYHMTTTQKTAT